MVRHYKRKTNRASYSKEKLLEAVEKVRNGTLSAYRASIIYGIPRPTIVNRENGKRGVKFKTLGRRTVLSTEEETVLARNLQAMEKYGFGLTRQETMEVGGSYVKENNIANPFKNGVPGEQWFTGFKKRHNLSVKKPHVS